MSASKAKQKRREEILKLQRSCIYCGDPAGTVDHCPPRTFFRQRQWPEGYEFPACGECNSNSRLDEQALAALVRIRLLDDDGVLDDVEFFRIVQGVNNNQPDVVREWNAISRDQTVDGLRQMFGRDGYKRFGEGWGAITLGPLTHGIIRRFMIKLGQALYYKHVGEILDGVVYAWHIDRLNPTNDQARLDGMLELAPEQSTPERNGKSLRDQFIYRFNCSSEMGALHAVVQFSEQFIFQLIVMRKEMEERLEHSQDVVRREFAGRHECYLAPDISSGGSA